MMGLMTEERGGRVCAMDHRRDRGFCVLFSDCVWPLPFSEGKHETIRFDAGRFAGWRFQALPFHAHVKKYLNLFLFLQIQSSFF